MDMAQVATMMHFAAQLEHFLGQNMEVAVLDSEACSPSPDLPDVISMCDRQQIGLSFLIVTHIRKVDFSFTIAGAAA